MKKLIAGTVLGLVAVGGPSAVGEINGQGNPPGDRCPFRAGA